MEKALLKEYDGNLKNFKGYKLCIGLRHFEYKN